MVTTEEKDYKVSHNVAVLLNALKLVKKASLCLGNLSGDASPISNAHTKLVEDNLFSAADEIANALYNLDVPNIEEELYD